MYNEKQIAWRISREWEHSSTMDVYSWNEDLLGFITGGVYRVVNCRRVVEMRSGKPQRSLRLMRGML
jgi:hypothetical protein